MLQEIQEYLPWTLDFHTISNLDFSLIHQDVSNSEQVFLVHSIVIRHYFNLSIIGTFKLF
jgi:hypothetical protein